MSYEKPEIKSLDVGAVMRSIGPASALISGVQQPIQVGGGSNFAPNKEAARR